MKKKIFSFLILVAFPLYTLAQISTNIYYDGYWGTWKKEYDTYTKDSWYQLYGNNSGFIIYNQIFHPSQYFFKFQIDSYSAPSKEERKNHRKNDIWYEYTGTVEYFVNSDYPTIKDALKGVYAFPCVRNDNGNKRTARAIIKIAPYKKYPQVYNIWFEDVGIAIDLGSLHFNQ